MIRLNKLEPSSPDEPKSLGEDKWGDDVPMTQITILAPGGAVHEYSTPPLPLSDGRCARITVSRDGIVFIRRSKRLNMPDDSDDRWEYMDPVIAFNAMVSWGQCPETAEPIEWVRALDGTHRRRKHDQDGQGLPETEWIEP